MRKLRKITAIDVERLVWCETRLRTVRDNLKQTGAKQATFAVRRALKSIDGAIRHAQNARARQEREAR